MHIALSGQGFQTESDIEIQGLNNKQIFGWTLGLGVLAESPLLQDFVMSTKVDSCLTLVQQLCVFVSRDNQFALNLF